MGIEGQVWYRTPVIPRRGRWRGGGPLVLTVQPAWSNWQIPGKRDCSEEITVNSDI